MGADQNFDWNQAAASALDWWRDAGVDAAIDEQPRNWLARPAPIPAATTTDAVTAAPALPDTLAAFDAWRIGAATPEAAWPGRAIAAQGEPTSDVMIFIDMPEREDAASGVLMGGAAGRLFDRMLAAIGRSRETVYLTALCNVRPAAGRIAPEIEALLAAIARHYVGLVRPKRLLVMGNAPSRALLGADALTARGGLRALNLDAGTVPLETQAIASFHPRFLIEKPAAKAEAWKDLQMLIGGLES